MKKMRAAFAVMLGMVAGLTPPPPAAQAHTSSTFYSTYWPGFALVSYGMHIGFPTGAFRSVHVNGKDQWNNAVAGREPEFYWSLPDDVNYGSAAAPCNLATNTGALFWNDLSYIGANTLGFTRRCWGDGTIATFTIEFAKNRPWYVGTGDAPSNKYDWWGAVAHEFGHATGWSGHFGSTKSICASNSGPNTMCPTHFLGTEWMRTLATHDVHTFDGAY